MNHAGEIRMLVALAEPDVRVWTNVGNAHIGHFGGIDEIAEAKAEILEGLTARTVVVVNADDPRVMRHVVPGAAKTLTFGIDQRADVWAQRVEDLGFDGTKADVTTPWGDLSLTLALAGDERTVRDLIDHEAQRSRVITPAVTSFVETQ